MLIDYSEIIKKYNLNIENILHVGAHTAEEHDVYFKNNCKKVIWIEANPFLIKNLQTRLDSDKNDIYQAVVSDTDDKEIEFYITNNNQSSSILDLKYHKNLFPDVYVTQKLKLKTKTLNTLFIENNLSFKDINFINLDIQGAELLALKGINDNLSHVSAIYTEINTAHLYEECALLNEIDEYLSKYNFKRVETKMWENHPWGDALYIKED